MLHIWLFSVTLVALSHPPTPKKWSVDISGQTSRSSGTTPRWPYHTHHSCIFLSSLPVKLQYLAGSYHRCACSSVSHHLENACSPILPIQTSPTFSTATPSSQSTSRLSCDIQVAAPMFLPKWSLPTPNHYPRSLLISLLYSQYLAWFYWFTCVLSSHGVWVLRGWDYWSSPPLFP